VTLRRGLQQVKMLERLPAAIGYWTVRQDTQIDIQDYTEEDIQDY